MRSNYKVLFSAIATMTIAAMLLTNGTAYAAAESIAQVQNTSAGTSASVSTKDEIVYARLAAGGGVQGIYVVNRFEVATSGTVVDHGDYAQVVNLTDTSPLEQVGNAVTFQAQQGNFYYQGNTTSTNLPWIFSVTYLLDGITIEPQQLAGRSGALEIRITSRANTAVDATFYNNYMLQISVTLDTDLCSGIQAQGGTMASAGKNQIVTFTAMPGKDVESSVKAQVEKFSMAGIEVAGIPYSMSVELPDTDEMVDEMVTLADAIDALSEGMNVLNSGAVELNNGMTQLVGGSADFAGGLALLSGNTGQLVEGSSKINEALALMSGKLNNPDGGGLDISQFAQLPDTLDELSNGLSAMTGSLVQVKDYFVIAYGGLEQAIAAIPDYDADALVAAVAGSDLDAGTQATLTQLLGAAQAVKGAYFGLSGTGEDGAKAAFDGMVDAVNALSDPTAVPPAASIITIAGGLSTMASQMRAALSTMDLNQLQKLAEGLAELSTQYGTFHGGLMGYVDGVVQAANGYGQVHGGLVELQGGTGKLASGTADLNEGVSELNDAVADLPDTIQVEIDKLMEEYTSSDFAPVSFTSPLNTNTGFVQFVMMFEGIELPEAEGDASEELQEETLWDRLAALF